MISAQGHAAKLRAAAAARHNPETFIIARTDALAPLGLDEAMRRAELYLNNGADGIYIEAVETDEQSGYWPDAVVIPKGESADEIRVVADVLEDTESTAGIIPMVELARAVFAADRMADAHERVCGLFLGGGDLAADLGAEGAWENLLYARSRMVAAAASSGIAAIDVPYFHADEPGLEREATASGKLGMTGKAALHAAQLAAINTVFTPGQAAVAHARTVMDARTASGAATPVLNGHVVEPAMLREAERVLAIAARESTG